MSCLSVLKGCVTKIPLERMPIVYAPFKRVTVDLIGPLHPPSDEWHHYILTLMEYATRYPEAAPLNHYSTEVVTEALVDIYSDTGKPEVRKSYQYVFSFVTGWMRCREAGTGKTTGEVQTTIEEGLRFESSKLQTRPSYFYRQTTINP